MTNLAEGVNLTRTLYLLIAGLVGVGIWIGGLTTTVQGQTSAQVKQEGKLEKVHELTTRIDERQKVQKEQLGDIKRILQAIQKELRK